MGHPQTQQVLGKSRPAALTWLLPPTKPQGGEMRASLLTAEVRQVSCCSWPLWLTASSWTEFFKISLLTESP